MSRGQYREILTRDVASFIVSRNGDTII